MNLRIAGKNDAGTLMPLVRAYHDFENIRTTELERTEAIAPLLSDSAEFGRIWLIEVEGRTIGYIALCFG